MGEIGALRPTCRFELAPVSAGRAILHLKAWARAPVSLPSFASRAAGARLLALGPEEWLMVCDSVDGPSLHAAVADLARTQGMAAVDLSHGMICLRVGGTAVRDVLSMGCGLDLHTRSFPAGNCTRTRLAQLAVVIECTHPEPRYELYVGTSHAAYLEGWLRDAAAGTDG
jgi:sarcosine oxidase, subunit gamma